MTLSSLQWILARAGTVVFTVVFVTLVATNYSAVSLHSKHLASAAEADLAVCRTLGPERSDAMRKLCHTAEHIVESHTIANDLLEALKLSLVPHSLLADASGFKLSIVIALVLAAVIAVLIPRCLRARA